MTLGLGRETLVRIPVDDDYAMRPDALDDAIAADRAAGRRPIADRRDDRHDVVDLVDPVDAVADVAEREGTLAARRLGVCRRRRPASPSAGRRSPAGSAPIRSS